MRRINIGDVIFGIVTVFCLIFAVGCPADNRPTNVEARGKIVEMARTGGFEGFTVYKFTDLENGEVRYIVMGQTSSEPVGISK